MEERIIKDINNLLTQLFQKMHDAGYKWDAEKKELNKIHNALEECEIENIEHGKYYYCIKDYFAGGKKQASKGDVVQALRGLPIMALGVKANEYFLPVNSIKQIHAWTPMDEQRVENLLAIIEGHGYPEEVAWLNSLKNRVQPQQEWSNWDKTIIESIEALCDDKIRFTEFHDVKEHANDIKEWLKSLKYKYTWKPSEEQLGALWDSIKHNFAITSSS